MTQVPDLKSMLNAGLHFGHRKSKKHPKMDQYVFDEKNGVYVIDLEKTAIKLQEALAFVKKTAAKGGVILFLGTKHQAAPIIKKYAEDCGMPYIASRWLGGTITNFAVISRLIKKYKDLKEKKEKGDLKGYTKKEQLGFDKEIIKMEKFVGGIAELHNIPDAIYLIDVKVEKTAVAEARNKKVPVVAICDVNVNPELIDYPIPGNDDATKGIELITSLIADAVKEGKEEREKEKVIGEKR